MESLAGLVCNPKRIGTVFSANRCDNLSIGEVELWVWQGDEHHDT